MYDALTGGIGHGHITSPYDWNYGRILINGTLTFQGNHVAIPVRTPENILSIQHIHSSRIAILIMEYVRLPELQRVKASRTRVVRGNPLNCRQRIPEKLEV